MIWSRDDEVDSIGEEVEQCDVRTGCRCLLEGEEKGDGRRAGTMISLSSFPFLPLCMPKTTRTHSIKQDPLSYFSILQRS